MNEETRYKIQFIDNEEDTTRSVRLSLRSLRMIVIGAGAAALILGAASVLSVYTLMNNYSAGADPPGIEEGRCSPAGP